MQTRTPLRVALLGCVALQFAHPRSASAQVAVGPLRSQKAASNLTFAQIATVEASPNPVPAENLERVAETERVMVTGSYIPVPTAAEVGPNPVQIVDRSTIEESGERSTEQLLRNLSLGNANGVPISGNAGMLEQGGASVSLRGFDAGATLVLIDGHRMAPHPAGAIGGFQFFVDLNSIPKAAIDSIEILKDGASTTYGADAVAGVVNIKLRHDFRGAEFSIEYGNTTTKDSAELATSLVFGLGNADTNVTGVLSYYRREAIFRRDRAYDREVPLARVSYESSPYNLQVDRAAAEAAAGRPITEVSAFDANGNRIDTFFAHALFLTNGTAPASDYVYTETPSVTFPVNRFAGEFPESERYGVYLNADHKLFGERLVAYADVFFQRVDVVNEQAPAGTTTFQRPGLESLAIPPHAPGATLGGPTYEESGVSAGAYNPFNPFQQIISGGSLGRLPEFGNRRFDSRIDAFFTTAGLRGDKLFDGSWGYDAAFRYSRVESNQVFTAPSTSRFNRILNAADSIFDPASPQYIGTTVPFNPFGDYRVPIRNNQRFSDFVTAHALESDLGTLAVVDVNIYTTHLFGLPAGGVALAVGGQFQHETNDQSPDFLLRSGDLVGSPPYFPVHGQRESYAIYVESSVPIFGANFRAAALHALDLTAAVRHEAFLNNGSNITAPKFGTRWQPFDDSFTIRATWGEGYKQPTLVELFAPVLTGNLDVFDPVKGRFLSAVPATLLPNPRLQAEDSRNFTAGIVYSPKFVPGLTITIDLFDIETTGWINPLPNPTDILARVASGNALPFESATRDANGNLLSFTAAQQNTGTQKARGVDLGIVYQRETSFGSFTSNTQVTLLDSFQFSSTFGETERELRSQPVVSFFGAFSDDAYLKWKGTSRLDWAWRGLGAAATARYRDGFHEFTPAGNEHWVRQTWFFDLQASYDFRFHEPSKDKERVPAPEGALPNWKRYLDRTSITVGCTNVFDHAPPKSNDNFPRFIYDPTGRFVYLSVTKKF